MSTLCTGIGFGCLGRSKLGTSVDQKYKSKIKIKTGCVRPLVGPIGGNNDRSDVKGVCKEVCKCSLVDEMVCL